MNPRAPFLSYQSSEPVFKGPNRDLVLLQRPVVDFQQVKNLLVYKMFREPVGVLQNTLKNSHIKG